MLPVVFLGAEHFKNQVVSDLQARLDRAGSKLGQWRVFLFSGGRGMV